MVDVKIDMTGWKMWEHGVPDSKLTVIEQADDYINPTTGKHSAQWLCECSCDEHNKIITTGACLRSGNTKSCGCLMREIVSKIGQSSKKYNDYRFYDDIVVGTTINTGAEFYVDLKNYDKIKDLCWTEVITSSGFHMLKAKIPGTQQNVSMHKFLGYSRHDHIDRNELNNLESNLRPATQQQNMQNKSIQRNNTSGIIGVSWVTSKQQWIAQIQYKKHHYYLGSYDNKDDAIKARLRAEIEYFGEFAPQKHLYEKYQIVNEL